MEITQEQVDQTHGHKAPRDKAHRRTHGMIGFLELASVVGARWKALAPEYKKMFYNRAQLDRKRCEKQMLVWGRTKQEPNKEEVNKPEQPSLYALMVHNSSDSNQGRSGSIPSTTVQISKDEWFKPLLDLLLQQETTQAKVMVSADDPLPISLDLPSMQAATPEYSFHSLQLLPMVNGPWEKPLRCKICFGVSRRPIFGWVPPRLSA